ncbi:MAG: hypothetical protein WBA74_25700 [Cyclobacteriaceae bacterium]
MKKKISILAVVALFFLANSCATQNDFEELVVEEEISEADSNSNGTGDGHGGDINPPPARINE